jgi:hypothetical protein
MNTTSTTSVESVSGDYIGIDQDDKSDQQTHHNNNNSDRVDATTFSTTSGSFTIPPITDHNIPPTTDTPNGILYHFIFMSILFSSNHGCVVACLSLATARLGSLGAYQNGMLYVYCLVDTSPTRSWSSD